MNSTTPPANDTAGWAVIADVGPGANPYHARHQRPGWTSHPSTFLPNIPADMPALNLTYTGDQAADLAADAAVWKTYRPGTMYWVPQTNLLLLTQDSYVPEIGGADGYNIEFFHGIATADAVGQACPNCYVLVIQDWGNIDGSAMRSIATDFPWVDFATSTSWGFGNEEYASGAVAQGYAEATRLIWERGGIAFGPTGNGIVTPNAQIGQTYSTHFISFPPWVVLVGGSQEACMGVAVAASKPTEFVADFTQLLAVSGGNDSVAFVSGTSFSTPRAAGLFGQVLAALRGQLGVGKDPESLWDGAPQKSKWLEDGQLTNSELRDVLSHAAVHFETQDFNPNCPFGPNPFGLSPGTGPSSPTPWVDMGWGHLGDHEAQAALAFLLGGPFGEKDPATAIWMAEFQGIREQAYPA